ncbi:shikimate dehydrogenase [Aliikangiella coralliicola]|uniref:shikimate dehydrogenase (NADP(+)) n=1 Tax=Aliikangiella coralliicola TaxID=2592383 RepID=A0A545UFC8_9GAMM|nr:shikimate dehydrogenase [Aliikangiella coralliicola]TQV88181.1 shikimate dehydrogenase [Aliikangiella coralliicola]
MAKVVNCSKSNELKSEFKLGVIGCPIKHSVSPVIHRQFSQQFNHQIDYQKYLVEPENLTSFVSTFFTNSETQNLVKGLNVTLPHKQLVIDSLERLTEEASLCQSVNTIFVDQNGKLTGDTTDGRGLLYDLEQLDFAVSGKNILVVGAGGASQSILVALLKAGASIQLLNRTQDKAEILVERFSHLGKIATFSASAFGGSLKLDGVISSISEFNGPLMSSITSCIDSQTYFYDLNYGERAESFRQFALANQCERFADGLGMLIGQAAFSYQIWTGSLPDVNSVKL